MINYYFNDLVKKKYCIGTLRVTLVLFGNLMIQMKISVNNIRIKYQSINQLRIIIINIPHTL